MYIALDADLRWAGDDTEDPGERDHHLASLVGRLEVERSCDSEESIQTDGDEDERGEVESKRSEEHHQTTQEVSGQPGHGDVPDDLQRHHDQGDEEIGYREVHDEQVDPWSTASMPPQSPENGQVPDRCNDA